MSASVYAQQHSGRVVNTHGEPVDFATVVLLDKETQVAVAITDTLGHFSLAAEEGNYTLKIQNIIYRPLHAEVNITSGKMNMGTFHMEEAHNEIQEVLVTASTLTREADRFIMQVNNNIPSLMNKDATEILQLAPGVWIDDSGISINGTTGTKVFINNREIKLTPKELTDYLRNYRSSDIARVEVIPQAGAEYSADSKGGVIRIILRKRLENGINGNIALRTTHGNYYEQYRPSATLNALVGKWTWNTSFSGSIPVKSKGDMMENRFYPDRKDDYFQARTDMDNDPSSYMGRLGGIFEIDHRNSLGAELSYWSNKDKTLSRTETTGFLNGSDINSLSNYNQKEKDKNFSATVNYIYQLDTLNSTFKIIVDYTNKKTTGDNSYHSLFQTSYATVDSIYASNSHSDYEIYTADAMLDKQFKNSARLTAGARYLRNNVNTSSLYESYYNSIWNPLEEYSYSLDYAENIGAAYLTFSTKYGSLKLLTGLRAEYTHTSGKNGFSKNYFDLFPSLNLTYSFNPMQTFMLIGQYGRKIERPNFWHLNSNRIQYSDYSYIIGNPQLRPTYINQISLTAVYKYRYTLTIGGNLQKDLIREVSKTDPNNPEIKYIIPENHHTENHYFAAISCPVKFTDKFSLNTNFVGVKQDIRGIKTDKLTTHYLYFINSTLNLTLPAQFYFEFSYNGTSRLYSANSGIEPSHLFHASLKRNLFENRMNISLGTRNLFNNTPRYFSRMNEYKTGIKMLEAWNARSIVLSLQYNFKSGKTFRKRTVESDLNSEKARMKKTSGTK